MKIYEDLKVVRNRLTWFRVGIMVVFIGLLVRYWQLQIVRFNSYSQQAQANHVRPISDRAPRGLVLDRNGSIVAENRPAFNLILEEERVATLSSIERLVELPKQGVSDADFRFATVGEILVKEDISIEEVARIEARQLELLGVQIEFAPRRFYPYSGLLAHVMGYVGRLSPEQVGTEAFSGVARNDYVGQSGIEQVYNTVLMGQNGVQRVVVNSVGRRQRVLERVHPIIGESIQLTVDMKLQRAAAKAFDDRVGSLVAIDPRNGQVLALASFPAYNPNSFSNSLQTGQWESLTTDESRPLTNRAIQGRYPPGSTFKLIVAAAALEENIVTSETEAVCNGGANLYGRFFQCHRSEGHGRINLKEALAESCNTFFYLLAPKLSIQTIARYARLFGLGALTKIDLPHEVSGLVPDPDWKLRVRNERWYPGETVSVTVGQGALLVTALQMVQVAATIGTSGEVYSPRLLMQTFPVRDANNSDVDHFIDSIVERRLNLRAETFETLQAGMFQAVNGDGTGGRARLLDVNVSGKTGTVQVASRERIASTENENRPVALQNHAWFIGYAPSSDPEIALAILVEHGGGGGQVAAPIAQQVLRNYFDNRTPQMERDVRKAVLAFH